MGTNATIRWGVLGGARVNERVVPAMVSAANVELVAIASRRPGGAQKVLEAHAPQETGVTLYEGLVPLLDDDNVQAVYLPLANHEHAEWALKSIERGKHVLIEKPMALTVEDIEAIENAAAKHNVKVMEGFMYRFHPQFARVRELIDSGAIGEVKHVRGSYGFLMQPKRMYRLTHGVENGGGAMWDTGPYAVHSLRSWFGRSPVAVSAIANYTDSGADTVTTAVLDFGNGKHGEFTSTFECARRSEFEITGTEGGIKCHNVWPHGGDVPIISWWAAGGQSYEERLSPTNHFVLELRHFSECVLNDGAPLLPLSDAKENCRVICAVVQAARERRVIELE